MPQNHNSLHFNPYLDRIETKIENQKSKQKLILISTREEIHKEKEKEIQGPLAKLLPNFSPCVLFPLVNFISLVFPSNVVIMIIQWLFCVPQDKEWQAMGSC